MESKIDDQIITVILIDKPSMPINQILREPLQEIRLSVVKGANCGSKLVPWHNQFAFKESLLDRDPAKVPWPIYRDWTEEAASLSDQIIEYRTKILAQDLQKQTNEGIEQSLAADFVYSAAL